MGSPEGTLKWSRRPCWSSGIWRAETASHFLERGFGACAARGPRRRTFASLCLSRQDRIPGQLGPLKFALENGKRRYICLEEVIVTHAFGYAGSSAPAALAVTSSPLLLVVLGLSRVVVLECSCSQPCGTQSDEGRIPGRVFTFVPALLPVYPLFVPRDGVCTATLGYGASA